MKYHVDCFQMIPSNEIQIKQIACYPLHQGGEHTGINVLSLSKFSVSIKFSVKILSHTTGIFSAFYYSITKAAHRC